ncbi:MAG: HGGxSTG domain-containing protein [Verrucomicrobia bacterium]|nr:HGGxSTG domain-containing protein [Verrucomicrobiota bacterium]
MDTASTPCGARTRSGTPCKRFPVPGKRRCRMHGGLSTGPKTPHKLHGVYSLQLTEEEQSLLPQLHNVTGLAEELALCRLTIRRICLAGPKVWHGSGQMDVDAYLATLDRYLGRVGKLLGVHVQAVALPAVQARLLELENELAAKQAEWSAWAALHPIGR